MKLALITDQHFGCRSDSHIFLEYQERFYKEIFFPYIDENKIDAIVDLGDTLDRRKFINYLVLNQVKKFWFDEVKKRNLELHALIGNHSAYFKNTNEVNSLRILFDNIENFHIYEEPTVLDFEGTNILMFPWIVKDNEEAALKVIEKTKAEIIFGHFDLIGFDQYKGLTNIDNGFKAAVFEKFDMVISGHYHHKSSKNNIHYLGAPYEMVWSDYDDPRGFHVFDTDTRTLEFIENPLHIFNKIYYNDTDKTYDDLVANANLAQHKDCYVKIVVSQKSNQYIFDQFMEALYKENPADVSVVESVMDFSVDSEAIDESKDTLTILVEYIEGLPIAKENKKPVIDLMKQVYLESLSVEV